MTDTTATDTTATDTQAEPAASWPSDGSTLPVIHIIVQRELAQALAADDIHAGTVLVPLTRAMLNALSPEERGVFNALSLAPVEGAVCLSFAELHAVPAHALPFSSDVVNEATVTAALRKALAAEVAHREALAAKIRANPDAYVRSDGSIQRFTEVDHLAKSPGPPHPALAEIAALAEEKRRAYAAKRAADNARSHAEYVERTMQEVDAYLARSDADLVRRESDRGRWVSICHSCTMNLPADKRAALSQKVERAGQLAEEANQRDVEAMREFARSLSALAPLVGEGYNVTEGVLRHVVEELMRAIDEGAEGVMSASPGTRMPPGNADNPDVAAGDVVTRREIETAVAAVPTPAGSTVTVSRIRGDSANPYVVVTLAVPGADRRFITVKLMGHSTPGARG